MYTDIAGITGITNNRSDWLPRGVSMPLFNLIACVLALLIAQQAAAVSDVQDPDALQMDKLVYLEQNWSESDREWFYFTDQGSRLMSYDIFLNLEQPDRDMLFRDPLYLLGFGLLPASTSKLNPDGLPVGFSRNDDALGLTCAACHTQQIRYKNRYMRIDGGQAMLDLQKFLVELERSMHATLVDKGKFSRFAERMLGAEPDAMVVQALRSRLEAEYTNRQRNNRANKTSVPYGYARLDAFGAILNKGLSLAGVDNNFNEPDAPTSYPYLWDTPQHDYVEWDGSQSNSDIGALARNVGEVIGVFGQVQPQTKKWLGVIDGGYPSSIQARNLRALEMKVAELYSPLWPDIFPEIDRSRAKQGRALYARYCLACHLDIDRIDPDRKIKVRMSTLETIQTDPLMARNAIMQRGKTGIFEGRPRFYTVGEILGKEAPALYIVNNVMGGVLKNNPVQSLLAIRDAGKMGHPDEIHPPKYVDGEIIERGQEVSERALLAYKARPMNGIWAGAPYLHNGSVPNLYELMLPAAERSTTFYIGAWDYDPVKVGYVDESRPGSFYFDTTLRGNSNAGHEYGTGADGLPRLSDDKIWAIVEYMKTL